MRLAYTHRRNILISSLIQLKSYRKGYFRILSSDAGMFTSIIVNFPQGINIISKLELLNYKLLQHGVTVVLGHKLAVDTQFSEGVSNFLRLSYAELDTDVELTEASRRLTTAIEEFFEKGSVIDTKTSELIWLHSLYVYVQYNIILLNIS